MIKNKVAYFSSGHRVYIYIYMKICPHCKRSFKNSRGVAVHVRRVHSKTSVQPECLAQDTIIRKPVAAQSDLVNSARLFPVQLTSTNSANSVLLLLRSINGYALPGEFQLESLREFQWRSNLCDRAEILPFRSPADAGRWLTAIEA